MPRSKSKLFRVGLTGGIASGKTTAARRFASHSVPIIDTDEIARQLVEPGQPAQERVVAAFGRDLLTPDGSLDRRRLREIVFADAGERLRLEAILHPHILDEMNRRSATANGPYQIIVVPLLVETGLASEFDRVLLLDCPEQQQIQRLVERDGEDPAVARAMLAAQASRDERRAHADDVVSNDGDLAALHRQIDALHRRYLQLAAVD